MIKQVSLSALLMLFSGVLLAQVNELTLATTTSTKSSGLMEHLIPAFEKDTGYKVKLFSVGTGKALRMGRKGEVDALLVHAPAAEQKFVADGYGLHRKAVMKNDFIIIGPKHDPAKISGMIDVKQALVKIKQSKSLFLSRGDDSGTHKKELAIWAASNIEPYGDWYYELGAGMGRSLIEANTKAAYVIIDRGTWLAKRSSVNLVKLVEGDAMLENPYSVMSVNPAKHKHAYMKDAHRNVHIKAARTFTSWITGEKGKKIINELRVDGERLFTAAP